MKSFNVTDLHLKTSEILFAVETSRVVIKRQKKDKYVLMLKTEYDHMMKTLKSCLDILKEMKNER